MKWLGLALTLACVWAYFKLVTQGVGGTLVIGDAVVDVSLYWGRVHFTFADLSSGHTPLAQESRVYTVVVAERNSQGDRVRDFARYGIVSWPGDFSVGWLILLFGIPTAVLWYRDRCVPPAGRCKSCGYDLTGNVSGKCPECGRDCTDAVGTPRRPGTE